MIYPGDLVQCTYVANIWANFEPISSGNAGGPIGVWLSGDELAVVCGVIILNNSDPWCYVLLNDNRLDWVRNVCLTKVSK